MEITPIWAAAGAGVFGLLIGSFLNVVIYRLPKMMERQWAIEAASYHAAAQAVEPAKVSNEPFNLLTPGSCCQSCGATVRWYENVPILSFLFLRGRCGSCKAKFSVRYPLVEAATSVLFFYCVFRWGLNPTGLAWCFFSAALLVLALIDWDTTLLPDDITLPLLWAGLLCSAFQWVDVPLVDSVFGATAGYLSLWLVYWGFKLVTGKEGMGYGDFKLFAALGAWFGWQALVPIILMSSVIGAIVGILMKIFSGLREGGYVPFGPFLVGAALTAMVFGPHAITATMFRTLGL